ncbi:MAG: hypothetical protein K2X27_24910 [Candidatus Obscuribacterales bacterium]|nr:hypothetical protein [Candidatus Obscuribacterales bacterium]
MQSSKLAERVEIAYELREAPPQQRFERRDALILLLLFAVQAFCFLPVCFKIGFYLDDWLTFWNLHFAPHNFLDLLKASFSDPRMLTRPVQCFYYAATYLFFGDRPLPYHLLRFGLEFLGATFLYLALKKLSSSRFIAALSALFFLIYPSHDATHYWIGAGLGPGFGLTLYLASFCLSMYAFGARSRIPYLLAVLSYGLSAYCYEAFLPLLVMSFCGVLLLSAECRTESRLSTMGAVLGWFLPFIAIALSEPLFQRYILPQYAHVFLSPSAIDPLYAVNVFVQGLNVSLFSGLWSFLALRIREALLSFNVFTAFQWLAVCASSLGVLLLSYDDAKVRYRRLFTAAGLTFLASYLTFAVAAGYTPVLDTMLNRVNIGSSVAVSLLLALSLKWLLEHLRVSRAETVSAASLICLPLVSVMVLADLGMASFWACSWEVQKNVRFLIQKQAAKIKAGDAIILADTHRYLNWAPVFDGTWDFQSMLRMTLNSNAVSGGVVCDRLEVKKHEIQDVSVGYLCASYPSNRVTLLLPSQSAWIAVKSSSEFVEQLAKNCSRMPVSAETLKRWQNSLNSEK